MRKNPLFVDINDLPLTISKLSDIKNPLVFPPSVTLQGFNKEITSLYTCLICKEVMTEPVKTLCPCHVTICIQCFRMNNTKCPICRKVTGAEPDENIRKILGKQEIICKCGVKFKHGDKEDHEAACKLSSFSCPQCRKEFNGPEMILHLRNRHYAQILNSMGRVY